MKKITYDLPESLIAQYPLEERDQCRMLHLDRESGNIGEYFFYNLLDILTDNDLLVLNETVVRHVRLYGVGTNSGRRCEVFLVDKLSEDEWVCLVRPGKRAKKGFRFYFSAREYCEVVDILRDGSRQMKFNGNPEEIMKKYGNMPLPPYIKREAVGLDRKMYQTVYASEGFSIAAPTAGLHFTEKLLSDLEAQGVENCKIRLDVGRGTFKPIDAKIYERHKMDSEEFWISKDSAKTINKAVKKGKRIVAVGSTVVRALEGCLVNQKKIKEGHYDTDIFIYPGYEFKIIDAMITNFHLPESSLLAMVAALAGDEKILEAYEFAVKNKYRFYSYGDAMIIT